MVEVGKRRGGPGVGSGGQLGGGLGGLGVQVVGAVPPLLPALVGGFELGGGVGERLGLGGPQRGLRLGSVVGDGLSVGGMGCSELFMDGPELLGDRCRAGRGGLVGLVDDGFKTLVG